MTLSREQILGALRAVLEPAEFAQAFYEAGSTAMKRADQWSDLDLQVIICDGKVDETVSLVEGALSALSPTELRYEVPRPAWHGHWQCFYKLEGASPYLLIDLCIMEASNPNRFLEPEIHGSPAVLFDKAGLTMQVPSDAKVFAGRLRQRIPLHEAVVEMMHGFVDKEILRGRYVDAFSYYHGLVLGRLVELLRIRHCPWRYNFGFRYLERDLPAALHQEVQSLLFVAGPQELAAKKSRAVALIRSTLAELQVLDLQSELEQSREK